MAALTARAPLTMNLSLRPRSALETIKSSPAVQVEEMDVDADIMDMDMDMGIDTDLADMKPPCFFLLLPAEIRNAIYRLLLTYSTIPHLRSLVAQNHCSSYVLPPLSICANFLSTCRQIYTEAMPILYSTNTFNANTRLLTSLPCLLDPSRPILLDTVSKRIRRWYIHVRLDCDVFYTDDDVSAAFTGAEELEVEASQSMYRSASMRNLLKFKGVRGVKHARVWGSMEYDFAEWLSACMMAPVGTEMPEYMGCGEENYDVWAYNR